MKLRRGIANSRSIVLTHEEALGTLAMLESLLSVSREKARAPEMPCSHLSCGYPLCELMRLLQQEVRDG